MGSMSVCLCCCCEGVVKLLLEVSPREGVTTGARLPRGCNASQRAVGVPVAGVMHFLGGVSEGKGQNGGARWQPLPLDPDFRDRPRSPTWRPSPLCYKIA